MTFSIDFIKEKIEMFLTNLYILIGFDRPSNHEEIHNFIYTDIIESSGYPNDLTEEDFRIAFRRYLEQKKESPTYKVFMIDEEHLDYDSELGEPLDLPDELFFTVAKTQKNVMTLEEFEYRYNCGEQDNYFTYIKIVKT